MVFGTSSILSVCADLQFKVDEFDRGRALLFRLRIGDCVAAHESAHRSPYSQWQSP
jgi:hypothetical protein